MKINRRLAEIERKIHQYVEQQNVLETLRRLRKDLEIVRQIELKRFTVNPNTAPESKLIGLGPVPCFPRTRCD